MMNSDHLEQDPFEREQLLSLFIEHAPVALAMFDRDMRYLSASRRWSRYFCLGDRDLIGQSHYDVFPNHLERWKEAHRRGLSGEIVKEEEDFYKFPDGSISWARWELHPWFNQSGDIGGIVLFIEEITERKMAEEHLRALNEHLERRVEERTIELQKTQAQYLHAEKLSAIGKLSASIAHEFNSPLQGLLSILQGFNKTLLLENKDKALLELAVNETIRLRDLIRCLQDFNRPSAGQKLLLDMHVLIDSVLLLCKSHFKKKRISTQLCYAENIPLIYAIPDQIKQVILNLLDNAVDACDDGGRIKISTWRKKETVGIAISDNGRGIEPEKLDLIFQPFYTTKLAVKGTGLGLSISHGIIKSHHGEIRVESELGKGTSFTVLLPIKAE